MTIYELIPTSRLLLCMYRQHLTEPRSFNLRIPLLFVGGAGLPLDAMLAVLVHVLYNVVFALQY